MLILWDLQHPDFDDANMTPGSKGYPENITLFLSNIALYIRIQSNVTAPGGMKFLILLHFSLRPDIAVIQSSIQLYQRGSALINNSV